MRRSGSSSTQLDRVPRWGGIEARPGHSRAPPSRGGTWSICAVPSTLLTLVAGLNRPWPPVLGLRWGAPRAATLDTATAGGELTQNPPRSAGCHDGRGGLHHPVASSHLSAWWFSGIRLQRRRGDALNTARTTPSGAGRLALPGYPRHCRVGSRSLNDDRPHHRCVNPSRTAGARGDVT
jgi:hypothetical protein